MKKFSHYLTEVSGDRVGAPHTPLKGHTDEKTAFQVDDYPYGFNIRTKIRYWLEHKNKKGWRFVSQTLNPKTNTWNKPKASTYWDFGAFMFQDQRGFVGVIGLSQYSSLKDAQNMLHTYRNFLENDVIKILEYIIMKKFQHNLT
jgi:hypothetical protein